MRSRPLIVLLLGFSTFAVAQEKPGELPEITRASLDAAIRRGVDFLITHQNPNGSWGGATRTKGLNIYAPLPGAHHAYRAGASGLALSGIIDAADPRPEVEAAIAGLQPELILGTQMERHIGKRLGIACASSECRISRSSACAPTAA